MNQKEILVEFQVKETSKVYQTSSGIPRMVYIYIYKREKEHAYL
jgi:hypothetical protein